VPTSRRHPPSPAANGELITMCEGSFSYRISPRTFDGDLARKVADGDGGRRLTAIYGGPGRSNCRHPPIELTMRSGLASAGDAGTSVADELAVWVDSRRPASLTGEGVELIHMVLSVSQLKEFRRYVAP